MSRSRLLATTFAALLAAAASSLVAAAPASAVTYTKCTGFGGHVWVQEYIHADWPVSSTNSRNCYLWKGDTGRAVVALQESLRYCYRRTDVVLDGSFGPITKSALMTAQTAEKITVDGSFGIESTSHMLFPKFKGPFGSSPASAFVGCYRPGTPPF